MPTEKRPTRIVLRYNRVYRNVDRQITWLEITGPKDYRIVVHLRDAQAIRVRMFLDCADAHYSHVELSHFSLAFTAPPTRAVCSRSRSTSAQAANTIA